MKVNGLVCEIFIAKLLQGTFSDEHVTEGYSNFVANVLARSHRRLAVLFLLGGSNQMHQMFLFPTGGNPSN